MKRGNRHAIPRLEQLPPDQFNALVSWLVDERLTYAQAEARLFTSFGVKTCAASLSGFWRSICGPLQWVRHAQAAASSQTKALLEIQIHALPGQPVSICILGTLPGIRVEAVVASPNESRGISTIFISADKHESRISPECPAGAQQP